MLCNAWVLNSGTKALEKGAWLNPCLAFKQRAKIFFCSITVNFRGREKCRVEKSFGVLEQVLQDVHFYFNVVRMLLGQVDSSNWSCCKHA